MGHEEGKGTCGAGGGGHVWSRMAARVGQDGKGTCGAGGEGHAWGRRGRARVGQEEGKGTCGGVGRGGHVGDRRRRRRARRVQNEEGTCVAGGGRHVCGAGRGGQQMMTGQPADTASPHHWLASC